MGCGGSLKGLMGRDCEEGARLGLMGIGVLPSANGLQNEPRQSPVLSLQTAGQMGTEGER